MMSDRTFYAIVGVLLVVLVGVVAVGLLSSRDENGINQSTDDFYAELAKINDPGERELLSDWYEDPDMGKLSITNVRSIDTIGTEAQCYTFRAQIDDQVIEAETLLYKNAGGGWSGYQNALARQHCDP